MSPKLALLHLKGVTEAETTKTVGSVNTTLDTTALQLRAEVTVTV